MKLLVIAMMMIFSNLFIDAKETTKKEKRTPSQSRSIVEEFKKAVGAKLGEYEPKEDPTEACPVGPLEIIEVDGRISILIGGQLLVSRAQIGKSSSNYDEGDCRFEVKVEQKEGLIQSQKIQKCKDKTYSYNAKVQFKNDYIEYDVETFQGKKKKLKLVCLLERKE